MTGTTLARIQRYPVKGFRGQRLTQAELALGSGLPLDRAFAVANGQVAIDPDAAHVTYRAFVRLTKNPELPLFEISFDQDSQRLDLIGPDGTSAGVDLGGPQGSAEADEALARWFGPGPLGPPRLEPARNGHWDHSDACVSLINLETIAEIETEAGQPVDPLRFRGNLYLNGLSAWEELSFVGRRLRIGDAELEILRPINRCRATSVDPVTGDRGLNLPALLARRYGHMYCGVYARVVQAGRLAENDHVSLLGEAFHAAHDGTKVATAPEPAQWPRLATVVRCVRESAGVTSFWLRDPLASLRTPLLSGQHVRVHAHDATGPVWRCYTVSGTEGDLLRISVKTEGDGARLSRLLNQDVVEGNRLTITGPFGESSIDESGAGHLLLVSAGIGITPMVAMLRTLVHRRSRRPVTLLHGARKDDLALWQEALHLLSGLTGGRGSLFLSQADLIEVRALDAVPGRLSQAALAAYLPCEEAVICGPAAFQTDVKSWLKAAGLTCEQIKSENFVSPMANETAKREPPAGGPFRVHFAKSGVEAIWHASDGTLLDLAEGLGLAPPSTCRSGACNSCRQTIIDGEFVHLVDPLTAIGADWLLLCCAVPTSHLTIAA